MKATIHEIYDPNGGIDQEPYGYRWIVEGKRFTVVGPTKGVWTEEEFCRADLDKVCKRLGLKPYVKKKVRIVSNIKMLV